jgi:spore coat protein H
MKPLFSVICTLLVITSTFAQLEGDQLFSSPQVVIVELEFSQEGWWDSLVANYETSTWMEADITITDAVGTVTYPAVGMRLKGNSSYSHPGDKKSFKIDFNEYVVGQSYDGLKKLNFSNCFKDPTFMRETIFMGICRDMGIPAPRTSYADVYMNGIHWGFYAVVEQIDDQFLDWNMEDDAGNMFKAGDAFGGPGEEANLVYYGTDQGLYEARYEMENNEDVNDWSDLIALIDFINNSSDADFENQLDTWLETDDFLLSMAMDNLFSNLDAYINSARNYYLYHHTGTNKWNWIKWDTNEAFGSYPGGPGASLSMTELDIDYVNSERPLLERVLDNDALRQRYHEQLCMLYNEIFTEEHIQGIIDTYYNLIQPYVYADDNKQYTNTQFDLNLNSDITTGGGPGGGTLYGLTSFVEAKRSAVGEQIDCSDVVMIPDPMETFLRVYPNPVSTGFWLETNATEVIQLISATGTVVGNLTLGWNSVDDLPAGVYFVRNLERAESVGIVKL